MAAGHLPRPSGASRRLRPSSAAFSRPQQTGCRNTRTARRLPLRSRLQQLLAGLVCFPRCLRETLLFLLLLLPQRYHHGQAPTASRPGPAAPESPMIRELPSPPRCLRGPARPGDSPGESPRAGCGLLRSLRVPAPPGHRARGRPAGTTAGTPGLPLSPSPEHPRAPRPGPYGGWGQPSRAGGGGGPRPSPGRRRPRAPLTVHSLLLEERGHGGSQTRSHRTPLLPPPQQAPASSAGDQEAAGPRKPARLRLPRPPRGGTGPGRAGPHRRAAPAYTAAAVAECEGSRAALPAGTAAAGSLLPTGESLPGEGRGTHSTSLPPGFVSG